jgi:hypothetical protein
VLIGAVCIWIFRLELSLAVLAGIGMCALVLLVEFLKNLARKSSAGKR